MKFGFHLLTRYGTSRLREPVGLDAPGLDPARDLLFADLQAPPR